MKHRPDSFDTFSQARLERLVNDMKVVKRHLEKANARVFLSGGTLLGAVREKDFIPWDWDVEYMVLTPGFRRHQFMRQITKAGYKLSQRRLSQKRRIFVRSEVAIEIFEFKHVYRDYYCTHPFRKNSEMRVPGRFLRNPGAIEFKGMTFLVPQPLDGFLQWRYGDWQRPIRPDSSERYITNEFERSSGYRRPAFSNLFHLTRRLFGLCDLSYGVLLRKLYSRQYRKNEKKPLGQNG